MKAQPDVGKSGSLNPGQVEQLLDLSSAMIAPMSDPYPAVKIHWVPKGQDEYIVKIMKARRDPKNPGKWAFSEAGLSIRFHGPKVGLQRFTGKRNSKKVQGPAVYLPGGPENLRAAIEAALAAFQIVP